MPRFPRGRLTLDGKGIWVALSFRPSVLQSFPGVRHTWCLWLLFWMRIHQNPWVSWGKRMREFFFSFEHTYLDLSSLFGWWVPAGWRLCLKNADTSRSKIRVRIPACFCLHMGFSEQWVPQKRRVYQGLPSFFPLKWLSWGIPHSRTNPICDSCCRRERMWVLQSIVEHCWTQQRRPSGCCAPTKTTDFWISQ